jgi:hypothetical protein
MSDRVNDADGFLLGIAIAIGIDSDGYPSACPPHIPEGFQQIAGSRSAPRVHARNGNNPGGVEASAGSAPREGLEGWDFSTKDTKDTKPIHSTLLKAVAPGPEGRQTIAQRVSAGFRPPNETSPGGATEPPSHTTADVRSLLHRSATPRSTNRISRKASKPPRGPMSPFWNTPASTGSKSARSSFTSDVVRRTTDPRPRPSLRLRGFAASRETLSPQSQEDGRKNNRKSQNDTVPIRHAAEPTRPRRTISPADKPSPHASVSGSGSASVSKTHGKEPGSIPIDLGSFGSPQAVVPGPEGRQTVAQRVSAGFRPPIEIQPQRGDRPPPPDERHHSLALSRTQRAGTRSGQAAKPRSRQGVRRRRSEIPLLPPVEIRPVFIHEQRRSPNDRHTKQAFFASSRLRVSHLCCGMKSHANNEEPGSPDVFACPLQPETHFHAKTPSPPRLEYPSSRLSWMRAEALLKRETRAQESGKKVAAIHRLLPAVVQLPLQFVRTIRNGIVLRMRWLAGLAPPRISMTA